MKMYEIKSRSIRPLPIQMTEPVPGFAGLRVEQIVKTTDPKTGESRQKTVTVECHPVITWTHKGHKLIVPKVIFDHPVVQAYLRPGRRDLVKLREFDSTNLTIAK